MSLRKYFKRLGRKTAKLHTKVNRVAVPVLAAGASYFGGPVAGAAVTAAGAEASRYFRATQARNEGDYADARRLGRGERKRVAILGAAGTGAGVLGSGITAAFTGGNIFTQSLLGQGGSQLFGVGGPNIFTPVPVSHTADLSTIVTQGNLLSQKSGTAVPNIVTSLDTAATTPGESLWGKAALGALSMAQQASSRVLTPRAPGPDKEDMDSMSPWELMAMQAAMGGGGGSDGDPSDSRGPRNAGTPGEGGGNGLLWVGGGLLLLMLLS